MNAKDGKGQGRENVLLFPSSSNDSAPPVSALEDAVFDAWVSVLRNNKAREELLAAAQGGHETIEALLRQSHFRARLKACIQAYLTEQIPQAFKRFGDALANGESWAFKVLLDALGFQQIAGEILPGDLEKQDVVISDAFERELTENIRDIFLGQDKNNEVEPTREKD